MRVRCGWQTCRAEPATATIRGRRLVLLVHFFAAIARLRPSSSRGGPGPGPASWGVRVGGSVRPQRSAQTSHSPKHAPLGSYSHRLSETV